MVHTDSVNLHRFKRIIAVITSICAGNRQREHAESQETWVVICSNGSGMAESVAASQRGGP